MRRTPILFSVSFSLAIVMLLGLTVSTIRSSANTDGSRFQEPSMTPLAPQPPIVPIPVTPFPPPQPLPPPPIPSNGVIIRSYRVNVTVTDQVAVTTIEQDFVNLGDRPAEGAYLFPLPPGAAVSNLTMFVNGQPIQAQILDANQARAIYNETVRRLRDPALLQYVGQAAIQANVFPIPPHDDRKIQITYSHLLTAEGGLISYGFPLRLDFLSHLPIQQMSVALDATSKDPISSVYSPDPMVGIARIDDHHFKAGFEATNFHAAADFQLFYGVASGAISANLLTYRASATEDGYFMLMLTPPNSAAAATVIPKDVVIVLDQSGSMQGPKWDQARGAVGYVLKHLNPQDRFNVIVFSTGMRIFAKSLQTVDQASAAAQWVNGLNAEGGTDINGALTSALSMIDSTRQTTVLFLTDGVPTEGVTDLGMILGNAHSKASPNVRIFTFGVGDDVNTFLLDSLSTDFHGASVYVRPTENVEASVSALYNKITAPVLTNIKLDFGAATVDDMYPTTPLPDLFIGSQLIVVGRFRGEGAATITLTGQQGDKAQTITFPAQTFPANAGGQTFVARLWATRKIGYLLNQIRLHGETKELVDEVVRLSVRYGIITPYTAYLIQESDIQLQGGIPGTQPPISYSGVNAPQSGSGAVDAAVSANSQAQAAAPAAAPTMAAKVSANGTTTVSAAPIQQVGDRTFRNQNGVWVDTQYVADKMPLTPIGFLSDEYFKLLDAHPELGAVFALGNHIIVVVDGTAYEVK